MNHTPCIPVCSAPHVFHPKPVASTEARFRPDAGPKAIQLYFATPRESPNHMMCSRCMVLVELCWIVEDIAAEFFVTHNHKVAEMQSQPFLLLNSFTLFPRDGPEMAKICLSGISLTFTPSRYCKICSKVRGG